MRVRYLKETNNHAKGVYVESNDSVNHPTHYTFGKFEVIDVLLDWFGTDPLVWQVGKYCARYMHKGKPLEDLKKARFYLDRRIKQLEEEITNA